MMMPISQSKSRPLVHRCAAAFAVVLTFAVCPAIRGDEQQLSEPIYRVANESSVAPAAAQPAATAPAAAPATAAAPFDFTLKPGDRPLDPVLRAAKESLAQFDSNVQDYSCTLVKRERVDGELGDFQHIFLKVRNEPFSVYLSFLQPFQGREVLYVAGQNDNELVVLEAGWKRSVLGKMHLDPEGMVAMSGQKYPITKVGIRNLLGEIIAANEKECEFAESEVTSKADVKISGRTTTMVQVVHPLPRQNFRAHIVRIFYDNELRVPIHYDSFMWPEQAGGQPPLEESYTYTNLKTNNGYTARDFDPNNNPEIFKP